MPKTEESVVIDRPIQEVWDFVDDPNNQTMWQSHVERFEQLDGGPRQVGTTFRGVTRVAGQNLEWTAQTTEYEPPRANAFQSIEAPMSFRGSTRLEPVGDDATRVTYLLEADNLGGFFGKLADPIVTRMYSRDVKASLENLKEILESLP